MSSKYDKPVVDGKLVRLSVSQLSRFDHRERGGCQAKWWYRYVGDIQEPVNKAAEFGKAGHARLEAAVSNVQKSLARGGDLGVVFAAHYQGLHDIDKPALQYIPIVGTPEDGLTNLELAGIKFQGSMDLVYGNTVYDYKYQSRIKKFESPTAQTWGYLEEIRRRRSDPDGRYRFNYILLNKEKPEAVSQVFEYSAQEVEAGWKAYAPLVEEMKVAAQAKSVDKVKFNTNSCYAYGACPYLGICHKGQKGDYMSFLDKLNEAKREQAAVELPDVAAGHPPDADKIKTSPEVPVIQNTAKKNSFRPPELEIDASDYERPLKAKVGKLKIQTVSVRHQVTLDIKRDGVFSVSIGLEMSAEAGSDPDTTRKLLSEKILDAIKNEAVRYAKPKD